MIIGIDIVHHCPKFQVNIKIRYKNRSFGIPLVYLNISPVDWSSSLSQNRSEPLGCFGVCFCFVFFVCFFLFVVVVCFGFLGGCYPLDIN